MIFWQTLLLLHAILAKLIFLPRYFGEIDILWGHLSKFTIVYCDRSISFRSQLTKFITCFCNFLTKFATFFLRKQHFLHYRYFWFTCTIFRQHLQFLCELLMKLVILLNEQLMIITCCFWDIWRNNQANFSTIIWRNF